MFFKCFLNVSCNEKKTFKKRHRNIFADWDSYWLRPRHEVFSAIKQHRKLRAKTLIERKIR